MASRYTYKIEVQHPGLNKYRLITGSDKYVVEQKVAVQLAAWDDMWDKRLEVQRKADERDRRAVDKQAKIDLAAKRTLEAQDAIEDLGRILARTLDVNDAIDWERLKDTSPFPKKKATAPPLEEFDPAPLPSSSVYTPKFGLMEFLSGSRKARKEQECRDRFERDHATWEVDCEKVRAERAKRQEAHARQVASWEKEKAEFLLHQRAVNDDIEARKVAYQAAEPGAVADYCDLVLSNSRYPDYFPQQCDLDYNPDNRILIVDYVLPDIESLPRTKEVKYVQSRDVFEEKALSDGVINKLYDDVVYQIALRTVHELFEADVANALDMVVFNGWVNSIDKATGKELNACIVSLQTKKEEFEQINLCQVDPKACFKSLKGVGSSKLHSITPIAPLLSIDREDKRFVSSYAVADGLDAGVNLAALDWEEFEHLIRELFEKEFVQSGGECKVTRASRDGGVDAVAFDPDPIRGGKIVIQAKRYTNTVGVSAVRDLYGTVVNEGATKGILVTTADYGPDAYEFAKGKPLTLLNGGNLLHLLERHGHKASIDLKAAKQALAAEL